MALDPSEQKLVDDVARHGWHVMRVASAIDEPYEPPFAYTIGLQASFGWPELLCYGLDHDIMAALLNNAVVELRARATPPEAGMVLRETAKGFACRLAPVAARHHDEHLGFAIWFARYRGDDPAEVDCLQLLWPDRNGLFPDAAGCSAEVREMQPVLAD